MSTHPKTHFWIPKNHHAKEFGSTQLALKELVSLHSCNIICPQSLKSDFDQQVQSYPFHQDIHIEQQNIEDILKVTQKPTLLFIKVHAHCENRSQFTKKIKKKYDCTIVEVFKNYIQKE